MHRKKLLVSITDETPAVDGKHTATSKPQKGKGAKKKASTPPVEPSTNADDPGKGDGSDEKNPDGLGE